MLISVILPIYNMEKYIGKCMDSILNQTYNDMEILLVDDGSPDSCPQICDQYERQDKRVKVIHKENGGLVSAWSTGVKNATGNYVTFIDPDDWISPRYIEIMVQALKETSADIVSCPMTKVWSNKQNVIEARVPAGFYDQARMREDIYPIFLNAGGFEERGISISRSAKLLSKKVLINNLKYSNERVTYSEDLNIIFPMMLDARSVYIVDSHECMYYYRFNPESMLNAYSKNMLYSIEYVHPTLLRVCDEKKHPEMKSQVYADYLAASVQYFKNELQNPEGIKVTKENIKVFTQKEMLRDAIDITEWKYYQKLNVIIIHCLKNYNWWNRNITTTILWFLKHVKNKK